MRQRQSSASWMGCCFHICDNNVTDPFFPQLISKSKLWSMQTFYRNIRAFCRYTVHCSSPILFSFVVVHAVVICCHCKFSLFSLGQCRQHGPHRCFFSRLCHGIFHVYFCILRFADTKQTVSIVFRKRPKVNILTVFIIITRTVYRANDQVIFSSGTIDIVFECRMELKNPHWIENKWQQTKMLSHFKWVVTLAHGNWLLERNVLNDSTHKVNISHFFIIFFCCCLFYHIRKCCRFCFDFNGLFFSVLFIYSNSPQRIPTDQTLNSFAAITSWIRREKRKREVNVMRKIKTFF